MVRFSKNVLVAVLSLLLTFAARAQTVVPTVDMLATGCTSAARSHQPVHRVDGACSSALEAAAHSADSAALAVELRERWASGLRLHGPDAVAKGEQLLREALVKSSDAGLSNNDSRALLARRSLALNLLAQDRPDEALAEINDVFASVGNEHSYLPALLFDLRQARAVILLSVGRVGDALMENENAVFLAVFLGSGASEELASLHYVRGNILLVLGRPFDTLKHANKVAEAAQALTGNQRLYDEALANRLKGAALIDLGRYSEALPLLRAAADAIGELYPNTPESGETLTLLGQTLVRLGRDDEATPVLKNASVAYRGQSRAARSQTLLLQIADGTCEAKGRIFDGVLRGARDRIAPQDFASLRAEQGWMARQCGDNLRAEFYLNDAADLVLWLTTRPSAIVSDDVAIWRRRYREIFEKALLVIADALMQGPPSWEHRRLAAAFHLIQLSRASGADLAIARVARRNAITDSESRGDAERLDELIELDRRARIKDRVGDLDLPVQSGAFTPGIEDARVRLLQRRRLLQSPQILDEERLLPMPLAKVQAALQPGEGLLVLAVGHLRGHVFAVTRGAAQLFPVQSTADELRRDVTQLLGAVTPRGACQDLPNFPAALAHQLHQDWLAPAREFFRNQGVTERVTVIPDGDFERLPLDMLLTESSKNPEILIEDMAWFAAAPWLARAWEITLAPSVAAALAIRRQELPARRAPAAWEIFGMADPDFSAASRPARLPPSRPPVNCLHTPPGAQTQLQANHKPPNFQDLPPLTAIAPILEKAAARWPPNMAMIAVGAEATEAYLWQHRNILASAAVVFFGTHGLRGREDLAGLDQPALALAPGGEAISLPDEVVLDGLLKADEVANLRLQARLVILAACNSAAADARAGEETFSGLPRAFLAAGARSVVVSHWMSEADVAAAMFSDLLTPDWISAPAPGLRAGRLRLIADPKTAHPTSWAAFSVLGTL